MKTLKIIIGFIVLCAAGKEFINAGRQIGFFDIAILLPISLVIFFCAWLIGTGFSAKKLEVMSFEFLRFLVISSLTFAVAALVSSGF